MEHFRQKYVVVVVVHLKKCTDECKSEVTVSDPKGLVEIFGKYFGSIYSVSKIDIPEIQPLVEGNGIEMIEFSKKDVMMALKSVRKTCAGEPDGWN